MQILSQSRAAIYKSKTPNITCNKYYILFEYVVTYRYCYVYNYILTSQLFDYLGHLWKLFLYATGI